MRKAIKLCLLLAFSCALLQACRTKTVRTPEELVSWLEDEDNGLRKTVATRTHRYVFQYKPAQYIISKEQRGDAGKSPAQRRAELRHAVWFNVFLDAEGSGRNPLKDQVSGLDEYNSRVNYFLADAARNFSLSYNGKQAEPVGYYFENNYGLTPTDVMVVGFKIEDPEPVHDLTVEYNDELYRNGIIKATFTKQDIQKIPTLNTEL